MLRGGRDAAEAAGLLAAREALQTKQACAWDVHVHGRARYCIHCTGAARSTQHAARSTQHAAHYAAGDSTSCHGRAPFTLHVHVHRV